MGIFVKAITIYQDELRREARKIARPDLEVIAQRIAGNARAAAPVLTGAYRNGIAVETDGDRVSVVDTDPDAVYKEYGTSDTSAHAVLTTAARAEGEYSGMQPRSGSGRRRRR